VGKLLRGSRLKQMRQLCQFVLGEPEGTCPFSVMASLLKGGSPVQEHSSLGAEIDRLARRGGDKVRVAGGKLLFLVPLEKPCAGQG